MSSLKDRRGGRRGKEPPRYITIAFCCNDPCNGNFADRCEGITFPSLALELQASRQAPVLRLVEPGIVLSGKHWPVVGQISWYGNWCWEAFRMQPGVATDFLIWLRKRRAYHSDGGWDELHDWYADPEKTVEPARLRALLIEAQREDRV